MPCQGPSCWPLSPEKPFKPLRHCRALVIGNNHYQHAPHGELTGCVEDAQKITAALSSGLFQDVTILTDAGRDEMWNKFDEVSNDEADCIDCTWVHFSGHGYSKQAEVYLVPVDSKRDMDDLKLSDLIELLFERSGKGLHIFTLDMCQTQRGACTIEAVSEAIDNILAARFRGKLFDKMARRYNLCPPSWQKHELVVFSAVSLGYAVEDKGLFSREIANYMETTIDGELLDMLIAVTEKVTRLSQGLQRPQGKFDNLYHRYNITRRGHDNVISTEVARRNRSSVCHHSISWWICILQVLFQVLWPRSRWVRAQGCVALMLVVATARPNAHRLAAWAAFCEPYVRQCFNFGARFTTRRQYGLIVLDGLIGCGKTTFLQALMQNAPQEVCFFQEPVQQGVAGSWWTLLVAFYQAMKTGTADDQAHAAKSLEHQIWQWHVAIATNRRGHTFTERGLDAAALVFCRVLKDRGVVPEEWYQALLTQYNQLMQEEFNRPTIVLYFQLPTTVALERILQRAAEGRFFEDGMSIEYLDELRSFYEQLYIVSNRPDVIVLDSNEPVEDMLRASERQVEDHLQRHFPERDVKLIMQCFKKQQGNNLT